MTEHVVVGGGFRDSRLGELAIARAEIILKSEDFKIDVVPIRAHPDDAGLIGARHLAPSWIVESKSLRNGRAQSLLDCEDCSEAAVGGSDAGSCGNARAKGAAGSPPRRSPGDWPNSSASFGGSTGR